MACGYTDMRKSIDGLAACVKQRFRMDPFANNLYLFCGRRCDWLQPLYDLLHEKLCRCQVLHADETVLQVLHEPGKTAQSKSCMWLYRTSGDVKSPIVLYDYQPDRRAKRPVAFLKGFQGYLYTNGYSGYHSQPEGIVVVGCWAHARRKFDEVLKGLSPGDQTGTNALRGKQTCDKLFAI
ncbi:MAG: transposase [Ethanoligenens sp.]